MILAIYWVAAFFAIVRLCAFARFTSKENNISGTVMLYVFAVFILAGAVFAVFRQ